MNSSKMTDDRKVILSTIWIFYIFNILYADVLTLMGSMHSGSSGELATEEINMVLSPEMLLFAAILLETAMVMIFLSRYLKYSANRWANIIIAILHTLTVTGSLFVGPPSIYYMFFATIEIGTSIFIVWYAWSWPNPLETSVK